MRADKKILYLLQSSGEKGVLQSEIPEILDLSKSTVSEILHALESEGKIIREKVSTKSFRVWMTENYPNPIPGVLRIGILKSTEYFYVILSALKCGALIRLFDDPVDLTRAVSQGKVDIAASPILTQTMMGILMKTFRIVRIVAKNGSGLALRGENGIYGTTEISTMDRNLRKYLSKIGKKRFRITYFNSPESIVDNLKKGLIDGVAIWEPYLTILRRQGYRVEYFRDILGDHFCCSICVNNESLRINGEFIQEFFEEYDTYCKQNSDEYRKVAEVLDFDEDVVRESLKSYSFCLTPGMDEIIDYIKDSGLEVSRESISKLFKLDSFT
jgi:predicted transcriptional regulator